MIHVDRMRLGDNGEPITPGPAWETRAAATRTRALAEGAGHAVDASVYGDPSVRSALEALFFDKCAYCEVQVSAGFDWDVEHFRPKGRVAESDQHPGYYWLAYTWSNLYPSCTHCNQRRIDRPRYLQPGGGGASGKVDFFPLTVEASRAMAPGDNLDAEQRLLIDPCTDDPESLLALGVKGLYVPRGGIGKAKARKTIDLLGLNRRRRLVDARRIWIGKLIAAATGANRDTVLSVFAEPDTSFAAIARAMRRDPAAFGL